MIFSNSVDIKSSNITLMLDVILLCNLFSQLLTTCRTFKYFLVQNFCLPEKSILQETISSFLFHIYLMQLNSCNFYNSLDCTSF